MEKLRDSYKEKGTTTMSLEMRIQPKDRKDKTRWFASLCHAVSGFSEPLWPCGVVSCTIWALQISALSSFKLPSCFNFERHQTPTIVFKATEHHGYCSPRDTESDSSPLESLSHAPRQPQPGRWQCSSSVSESHCPWPVYKQWQEGPQKWELIWFITTLPSIKSCWPVAMILDHYHFSVVLETVI